MARGAVTKRTRFVGALLLLLGVTASVYLYSSTFTLLRPQAGPLQNTDVDGTEWGFALIERQTGYKVRGADGLRFYFSWPQQKWLSVFAPPSGSAELAMVIANYETKTAGLKIYKLPRQEYDSFLQEFDSVSSGYRMMGQGLDGNAFSYERWRQGEAVSYSGNASFSSKDAKVYQIVESLVAKVSRGQ